MVIGDRLKTLREAKDLSQGDIEKRTGLLRCYVSRVENGHTVPSVETLEKFASALELPLYHLMFDGDKPDGHSLRVPLLKSVEINFRPTDVSPLALRSRFVCHHCRAAVSCR
jgi:transcriptional regulator with XRE-family HTH domain